MPTVETTAPAPDHLIGPPLGGSRINLSVTRLSQCPALTLKRWELWTCDSISWHRRARFGAAAPRSCAQQAVACWRLSSLLPASPAGRLSLPPTIQSYRRKGAASQSQKAPAGEGAPNSHTHRKAPRAQAKAPRRPAKVCGQSGEPGH